MKLKCSMINIKEELTKLFWFYLFGSVFGCVYETILCLMQRGYMESRQGLIYGPFSPIYGVGTVLLVLTITRIKDWKKLLITGAFVGGAFEYFASLFQEICFGTTSWNYSKYFMNFDGRTSLFHAVCWGIMALIFTKLIYPSIMKFIEWVPKKTMEIVTIALVLFMMFDVGISCFSAYRQKERDRNLEPSNGFEKWIDKIYPDEFMNRIYPNKKITKK